MSQSIADKYNQKYKIKDSEWFILSSDIYCYICDRDVHAEEVVLDTISGIYCSRCGIDLYNKSQTIDVPQPAEEPKRSVSPITDKPDWMILSNNYCYFCGVLSRPCEHIKRLK